MTYHRPEFRGKVFEADRRVLNFAKLCLQEWLSEAGLEMKGLLELLDARFEADLEQLVGALIGSLSNVKESTVFLVMHRVISILQRELE